MSKQLKGDMCDRIYGYKDSATTMRSKDGVLYCVSCDFPISSHTQTITPQTPTNQHCRLGSYFCPECRKTDKETLRQLVDEERAKTTQTPTNNDELAAFVTDPKNIAAAVEGSMDKRQQVLDNDELDSIFPNISNRKRQRLKMLFRAVLGEKFDNSESLPSGELRRNKVKNGYRVEVLQRLDAALGTKEKPHDI